MFSSKLTQNIEEIQIFYYIKSPKHGYANAYPAYPVPPPLHRISGSSTSARFMQAIYKTK